MREQPLTSLELAEQNYRTACERFATTARQVEQLEGLIAAEPEAQVELAARRSAAVAVRENARTQYAACRDVFAQLLAGNRSGSAALPASLGTTATEVSSIARSLGVPQNQLRVLAKYLRRAPDALQNMRRIHAPSF